MAARHVHSHQPEEAFVAVGEEIRAEELRQAGHDRDRAEHGNREPRRPDANHRAPAAMRPRLSSPGVSAVFGKRRI
jgi:hypothetical protein